ncbi:MAG TPA: RNase A-like domain-containing protein [Terriglobales bacterium]|nr:RNase A-like domain-containing protein [Terriglobales bacterium]
MVKRKKLFWIIALLLALALFLIFRPGHNPPVPAPKPVEHIALQASEHYDLARDEVRGGHTLARHIGKSDQELRERLENESISTDSTYSDRATAEMAVAAAIRENRDKIDRWLHRPGGHSNLVLDYDGNVPIGRSMRGNDAQSFPCSHAVVVLKWVSANDYYVLTSYPECWGQR